MEIPAVAHAVVPVGAQVAFVRVDVVLGRVADDAVLVERVPICARLRAPGAELHLVGVELAAVLIDRALIVIALDTIVVEFAVVLSAVLPIVAKIPSILLDLFAVLADLRIRSGILHLVCAGGSRQQTGDGECHRAAKNETLHFHGSLPPEAPGDGPRDAPMWVHRYNPRAAQWFRCRYGA
jgi:hypothetical protein